MRISEIMGSKGLSAQHSVARIGRHLPPSQTDNMVSAMRGAVGESGWIDVSGDAGKAIYSPEGFAGDTAEEVSSAVKTAGQIMTQAVSEFTTSLEAFGGEDYAKEVGDISEAQRRAAIYGALLSKNPKDVWGQTFSPEQITVPKGTENDKYINWAEHSARMISDTVDERVISAEAYDEQENKNAMVYTTTYNMQVSRQGPFGEMWYPTTTIANDQAGACMSIRLIQVYREQRHDPSGASAQNYRKRNIIEAQRDPSILRNDLTRIWPFVRPESADKFVDPALVAPYTVQENDVNILTAPLKMGITVNLKGLAQNADTLSTGVLDQTDAIDSAVYLSAIYISVPPTSGNTAPEVYKLPLNHSAWTAFNFAPQHNYRTLQLSYKTQTALFDGTQTTASGGATSYLANLATQGYAVNLQLRVYGDLNQEIGDMQLTAGAVEVASVWKQDQTQLDPTSTDFANTAALFAGATIVGYDVEARLTNSNQRRRGTMLDTTYYNQVYSVPLRAPMTIPRPLTVGDANDSADLAALITATHIRMENAAVDALFDHAANLKRFTSGNFPFGYPSADDRPECGIGRYLVQPFYSYKAINVENEIQALQSSDKYEQIQSVIVNHLRDDVFTAFTQTNYKPAADALAGGQAPKPVVLIGTDPYIARYLMVTGDLRLLADSFDVRIESSWNLQMAGKIFVSFGVPQAGRDGTPHPLHFGTMFYKSELVLVLPLHRNGGNSKELTVQPSFIHVNNLPILIEYDVTGITPAATSKIAIDFNAVKAASTNPAA